MDIRVRPTSVLIQDNRMLVVRQRVYTTRNWSMPGGGLEPGETIENCLKREMLEETGLEIRVKELLYLSDRYRGLDTHIVHMMFLVEPTSDTPLPHEWTHEDPAPSKTARQLREVRMVPLGELTAYGFTPKFQQVTTAGFPGKGRYIGDFNDFFGEGTA